MRGPELRLLKSKPQIRVLAQLFANSVRLVAYDQRGCGGIYSVCSLQYTLDHWPAGNRMKHFREARLHPGALASGQNDNMRLGRARHYWSSPIILALSIIL